MSQKSKTFLLLKQLKVVQFIINPSFSDQFIMVTNFDSFSTTPNHNNAISIIDGGEAMSNDNAGSSYPGFVKSLLHDLLTLSVKSRSSFIQEKDLRVSNESPSNGNTLFLSTAELSSLGSHIGIVALKQRET